MTADEIPDGFEWLRRENADTLTVLKSWRLRDEPPPSRPPVESLAQINANRGFPAGIGRTTRRHHLTGTAALNIPRIWLPGGDWHMGSSWHNADPWWLGDSAYSSGPADLADLIGLGGVVDARPGLQGLGHPAGNRREPVWAAAHDRAALEIAWRAFSAIRRAPGGLDPGELSRWLQWPPHWVRLKWWAGRLTRRLNGPRREEWIAITKEWSPWI